MHQNPWAAMRSLTRDGEVAKRKLAPGTIPRIVDFARPYRRQIAVFLVLVVLDALLMVALPLLFKVIVDEVSKPDVGSKSVVVTVALGVALLAVVDAGLTLWAAVAVLPGR
jgi:ATP-binding cassette subfamily B protein